MDGEAVAQAQDPNLVGPDGQPLAPGGLDENGLPRQVPDEEKVEEVIPDEILEDMRNLWSVFDMESTEVVDIAHLRVIMRALDFDLDRAQLAIVQEKIDPGKTGKITF